MREYVERRNGGYYLVDSRISLDSIVVPFQNGASPESILHSFPSIGSLEKVYGALTFCLANKDLVDDYLQEQNQVWDRMQVDQEPLSQVLREKIQAARADVHSRP